MISESPSRSKENISESTVASSKKALEAQWAAFETGVLAYLNATGQQAKEQEAAFSRTRRCTAKSVARSHR